ncbi:MAG: hypothetical protein IH962_04635 [Chloroflexi bacterium]|nr:hypothetical protein [Chloroflexota bacterium]
MSVYAIHKLLWLAEEDPEFRSRLQANPDEVVKEFPITAQEARALRDGDIHTLYQWGVSSFLMRLLPTHGLFGMSAETYRERISKETPRVSV